MAAFKRFISRRGKPQVMYSDEGRNFVGAKNEMLRFNEEILGLINDEGIHVSLATDFIEWRLNPPAAPHMGGLWEAGVKSMKKHLIKMGESTNFTIEEYTTLLCTVEACLNSRPLTPMSGDPDDLTALTPGHFLIQQPLLAAPEPDVTEVQTNRLDRWQQIQRQQQLFWRRWTAEYLQSLQKRPKWLKDQPNLQKGDLVIIKDETLPIQQWKMGRIQELHPGKDEKVRVATVKAATVRFIDDKKTPYLDRFKIQFSVIKRPIQKLCLLPFDKEDTVKLI
jgi:Family of unknown function (DUF5641)